MNCKRCDDHQATICTYCAVDYWESQTKDEISLGLGPAGLKALEAYQAQVNKEAGSYLTIAEAAAALIKLKLRESGFMMEEPYKA